MTKVEFYYDPGCPWCWVTSRWLLEASDHRDLDITWRPFSLALKNKELEKRDDESDHAESHRQSHRVLRVSLAAQQAHGTPLIQTYTRFGIKHHTAGFAYSDEWIANVLDELGLPAELIGPADDTSLDAVLADELQSAVDIVGDDVGVPTIVFTSDNGDKRGYFGPVLLELPSTDESLKLWDGLSSLASVDSFYELKRSRPPGGPDVASAARCQ